MENINCPLCGNDDYRILFRRKDLRFRVSDIEFSVVRCNACKLVYVNPRPTETELHEYYPDRFYNISADSGRFLAAEEATNTLKYSYLTDMAPGSLLEIGPSKGEFMMFMKQKGWQVHGIELSEKPANLFNLDIRRGRISDAGYVRESFDLIVLWAVLEHAYDPCGMLKDLTGLLKPSGRIVAAVTNFSSIPGRFMRHDDVPRHVVMFSRDTLPRVLLRAGLSMEMLDFNSKLFGGTHRGLLNYLFKLASGERLNDIVTQNRVTGMWSDFSSSIKGKPSAMMRLVDGLDGRFTPLVDAAMDKLGLGFIMVVRASKSDIRI